MQGEGRLEHPLFRTLVSGANHPDGQAGALVGEIEPYTLPQFLPSTRMLDVEGELDHIPVAQSMAPSSDHSEPG